MVDTKEIKGIPVISFALIIAIVLAVTMLVVGIVMALLGSPTYKMMPMMDDFNHMFVGGISALYFIVVMPIMVFIFGFLVTALATIIYNFIAPKIGGIKLELE
jgi:uncharacterized protein involved in cysteine biosynthesis